MLDAVVVWRDGETECLEARTVSEALARATSLGARSVRVILDGGTERYIRMGWEWVVLPSGSVRL